MRPQPAGVPAAPQPMAPDSYTMLHDVSQIERDGGDPKPPMRQPNLQT